MAKKKAQRQKSELSEAALKLKLVQACHLLVMHGQGDDIMGHATARLPGANNFWMKPALMGLEEIKPSDLILVDLDGKVLRGNRPRHGEVFIHAEIMRARPDVNAVIHTHPETCNAFSSLGVPLRPISHEGTYFVPPDVPRFTETTDLIITPELGKAVARTFGDRPALFLVNHGIAATGPTIEMALINALALDKAARTQLMVPGGAPRHWTPDEEALVKGARVTTNPPISDRWAYHLRMLAQWERRAR